MQVHLPRISSVCIIAYPQKRLDDNWYLSIDVPSSSSDSLTLIILGLGITGTDQLVLDLLVLIFWYWVNWYYVPTDTRSTGTKSTDTKTGTFIAR
jgi:hypothetical protein